MNPVSLWALQLLKEHEEICWYYKVPLKTPVIRIADINSAWGTWDHFTNTITISLTLITKHSWDVVLEVLKHEMAHQYVSEKFGQPNDTTHGELFKRACVKLGVSSWACKASGEIPEKIPTLRERVLSQEDERLLSKVEKLLSLAQSSNEHEALLAMDRVKQLYAVHRLDRLKRENLGDQMDSLILSCNKKKISRVESKIFAILGAHFKVKVIQTSLYDAIDCEKYKAAEILGRRENVLMAEYVYHFLMRQIESLWNERKRLLKCKGSLRTSYQMGVLSGFNEKLELVQSTVSSRQKTSVTVAEEKSLVMMENNELDQFVGLKYPRISKKSVGRGSLDASSFASGQQQGRQLNFNRPISSSKGFGGFLRG
jgi:hypothetical protein